MSAFTNNMLKGIVLELHKERPKVRIQPNNPENVIILARKKFQFARLVDGVTLEVAKTAIKKIKVDREMNFKSITSVHMLHAKKEKSRATLTDQYTGNAILQ